MLKCVHSLLFTVGVHGEIYNVCLINTTSYVMWLLMIQIPVIVPYTKRPGRAVIQVVPFYIFQRFLFLRISSILSPDPLSSPPPAPPFPIQEE